MEIYTDETGFKCREFLQDLKVGVTHNYIIFYIVVHCPHINGTIQSYRLRPPFPL